MCDILDPNLECAMAEKPGASLKIWQVFRENDDETMDGTSFSHFRTLDPKK